MMKEDQGGIIADVGLQGLPLCIRRNLLAPL
jgi:hypothetical protein